jgi:hypothetical protein
MSKKEGTNIPTAFFSQEEIERFQSLEGSILMDVNYFIWINPNNNQQKFLYCVELLFNEDNPLLLIADEDEEFIRMISIADFVAKAAMLREQSGGVAVIQQANPSTIEPWNAVVGSLLLGIRLTAGERGLYTNDVLLLEFVSKGVIIAANDRGGLFVTTQ